MQPWGHRIGCRAAAPPWRRAAGSAQGQGHAASLLEGAMPGEEAPVSHSASPSKQLTTSSTTIILPCKVAPVQYLIIIIIIIAIPHS